MSAHHSANEEHSGHTHDNVAALRSLSRRRLWQVFGLSGGFMLLEFAFGLATRSLAVLADAGHMLGDVAAISIALIASSFATKAATSEKTYGYYRAEILASSFNTLCMLGMCGFILYEAYRRLSEHVEVPGVPLIVIGIIGATTNLISMRILGADAKESLNTKAAYLEVLSDMLAALGVVVAGIIIQLTHWILIDSIVSFLIALALIPRTWNVLMECVHVLMEGTPDRIKLDELRKSVLKVDGVLNVHDLHVWTITSGLDALSGHVLVREETDGQRILNDIAECCQHDFNINHTTIQVEIAACEQKCD
ncbi:MAG TPA: cation diffusion facilitator family transporter [Drouetiella sp.]